MPKADGSRTLLVPNVKGAERMTFAEFAAAADDVVTRARTGKIKVSDFEGTTISLTNPGTLGTTASVPRLMPGQGAIIATGAIEYPAQFRAMAPATLSLLAVSKVVTFTSTYDHRIIQGAESGAFLARVEELLLGEHGFYEGVFADLGIPFRPLRWEVDKNPPVFSDGHHDDVAKQARVLELINAYRVRGHLLADIDPLRTREIAHHPELDLETYGLTIWDLDREFWTGGLKGGDRLPLREIIAVMRRVYCGKIGTEYRYISSPTEKYWIRERIAAAANAGPLPKDVRRSLLAKLIAAEEFERFLGTKFLGQRRYSVEGVDTAIPLLDRLVEGAARRGVDEVVDRHVPPRPAEHPGQRRRQLRRAHLQRLRGRRASGLSGRRGRREVPPGRPHHAALRVGPRRGDPGRVQPVAPRGGRSGRRGRRAGQAGADGGARTRRRGSARCRCCSTATRRSRDRAWSPRS